MSHLDSVRPSGQWSGEMVPCSADYERLDVAQSKIVSGDGGGLWNPTSPIIIGGAGITLSTAESEFTGGVTTKTGGRVVLANVAGNVPTISSAQSDTICLSAADMLSPAGFLGTGNSWLQDDYILMSDAPSPIGVQSLSNLSTASLLAIPRRYLHQGASFSKLKLHFRVLAKPTTNSLPSLTFGPWINTPSTNSPYANLAPNFGSWTSGMTASVGQYVVPALSPTNYTTGYYYKCTAQTGPAGSNPAIFQGETTIGGSFADGSITWTTTGLSGQLSQQGLDAAAFYNNGQPQTLEFDFDNASGALLTRNQVDHSSYIYGLLFGGIGDAAQFIANLNIELHSVDITFANIVDLSFT